MSEIKTERERKNKTLERERDKLKSHIDTRYNKLEIERKGGRGKREREIDKKYRLRGECESV